MYLWTYCVWFVCALFSQIENLKFSDLEKKSEETQTRDKEEAWFGEGGGDDDDDGCMWKSTHMHASMQ